MSLDSCSACTLLFVYIEITNKLKCVFWDTFFAHDNVLLKYKNKSEKRIA